MVTKDVRDVIAGKCFADSGSGYVGIFPNHGSPSQAWAFKHAITRGNICLLNRRVLRADLASLHPKPETEGLYLLEGPVSWQPHLEDIPVGSITKEIHIYIYIYICINNTQRVPA